MNIYISTFIPGFEKVIENILHVRLKGSKVLKVYSGLVLYRYNGNPMEIAKVLFFNNSYHAIRTFYGEKLSFDKIVNETVSGDNKYLNQKSLGGHVKTFRVRFTKENQFTKVSKKLALKAENEIFKNTKLKIDRLSPKSEFWYIIRRENVAYYAQLLFKREFTEKNLNKGELRPEFAMLMLHWANISPSDTVMDPFAGYGAIPVQLYKNFKFNNLTVNDNNSEKFEYLKKLFEKRKTSKIKITCKDATELSFVNDKSIDKIVTDPPWGSFDNIENIEDFYKDILRELKRVLKDDGEITVLSGKKSEFENAVEYSNLKIIDKTDTLVNGKKAALFRVVKK